jgi:hypothetical protein
MATSPPPRTPLTRRATVLLAIIVVTGAAGSLGVAIGAMSLQSDWSRGQLLQAGGVIAIAASGMAVVLLISERMNGQGSGIFARSWLNLPRLAWIVLGVGLFLALGNVVPAFIPALRGTNP